MGNQEWKRAKITGRGKYPEYLKLLHYIIDSQQFARIPGSKLKMLIDLARQFNGRNNGNFDISKIRLRWNSRDTTGTALTWLVNHGWIIKTKQGGLGMGPDLFAVTWWPIDECKGKHDFPAETVASHLWAKKTPARISVLAVPEIGTSEIEKRSIIDHVVPETGTRNADFKVA